MLTLMMVHPSDNDTIMEGLDKIVVDDDENDEDEDLTEHHDNDYEYYITKTNNESTQAIDNHDYRSSNRDDADAKNVDCNKKGKKVHFADDDETGNANGSNETGTSSADDQVPPPEIGNDNESSSVSSSSKLAQIVATIPSREDMIPEEFDVLYFTKNEYSICRSDCKIASRNAARSGLGVECLSNTFVEKPKPSKKSSSSKSSSADNNNIDNNNNSNNEQQHDNAKKSSLAASSSKNSKKSSSSSNSKTSKTTDVNNLQESNTNNKNDSISKHDAEAMKLERKLRRWTCEVDTKRGLERWSDKEHGDIRQREQFQVIMNVLEAQDDMLSSNNKAIDVEALRKVSYKATKAARHFARMMGKADSFAALHVDCDDPSALFQDGIDSTLNKDGLNPNNPTSLSSMMNNKKKGINDGGGSVTSVDTTDFGDDYSFEVAADEVEKKKKKKTISPFIRRFRFTSKKS